MHQERILTALITLSRKLFVRQRTNAILMPINNIDSSFPLDALFFCNLLKSLQIFLREASFPLQIFPKKTTVRCLCQPIVEPQTVSADHAFTAPNPFKKLNLIVKANP